MSQAVSVRRSFVGRMNVEPIPSPSRSALGNLFANVRSELRGGTPMPLEVLASNCMQSIFVARHHRIEGEHWIILRYRRVLACRVARVLAIPVYYPIDLFSLADGSGARSAEAN